jgi:hypothetical protein
MTPEAAIINGEERVLLIRTHWMQYVMPMLLMLLSWLLYFLCTAVSIALMQWNGTAAIAALIGGHALLLLFHHAAFYQIFSASTTRFLVTNKRILGLRQRLWLSDDTLDIPLWKIRSMEVFKKGFLQHVLDYGTIELNRGAFPSIGLVPHPNILHHRITSQLQQLQSAFGNAASDSTIPDNPHA